MYNGKKNESLNALRKRKYCEKVAKSLHKVEGKSLPPTTAASKFHSYRVYLQICQWKNPHCNLQEESWGWKLTDSGYSPVLIIHLPRLNCLKSFDVIAPQIALLQNVFAAKMVWNAHLPVVIVKALHVQMKVQWMLQKKILMKLMIKIEAFLNPKTDNQELGCIGVNIWFWVLTSRPNENKTNARSSLPHRVMWKHAA